MSTEAMADALYGAPASPETVGTLIDGGNGTAAKPAVKPTAAPANPAASLYPDAKDAAPKPAHVQEKRGIEHPIEREARQGDALYAEPEEAEFKVPDVVKSLRESDRVRSMYGAQGQYTQALPDTIVEESLDTDVSPEMRQALASEVREIAADIGMTAADIDLLKGVGNVFESPTVEQIAQWESQAVENLKRDYGDEWQSALADAKTLINRDPRISWAMKQNGRGSHPVVVGMIARLARQARVAGRLK